MHRETMSELPQHALYPVKRGRDPTTVIAMIIVGLLIIAGAIVCAWVIVKEYKKSKEKNVEERAQRQHNADLESQDTGSGPSSRQVYWTMDPYNTQTQMQSQIQASTAPNMRATPPTAGTRDTRLQPAPKKAARIVHLNVNLDRPESKNKSKTTYNPHQTPTSL